MDNIYFCSYCKKFRPFGLGKKCKYCNSPLLDKYRDSVNFYEKHASEQNVHELYLESLAEQVQKIEQETKRQVETEINRQNTAKMMGEYEYDIVTVVNTSKGLTDTDAIKKILTERSSKGWRLIAAYSNELGKNALSLYGFGVNATACQDVLYFERRLR